MPKIEQNTEEVRYRSRLRVAVLWIFTISVVAAFISYLISNSDKYQALFVLSPWYIILLLFFALATLFLNGAINTYMFRNFHADISYREGVLLAATSALTNQLPISGGIVAKAMYLKFKYNVSYTKYISSMLALFFCIISVDGFIGLAILLSWFINNKFVTPPLLWIGFGGMASVLILFLIPIHRITVPTKLLKMTRQVLEGWSLISDNRLLVLKLLGIQVGMMVLLALRYWVAFKMLSQSVTIEQTLLFASASVLTNLASFAPGGLGVREGIVSGIAMLLGFSPGTSIVAVGLDRIVSTVVIVLMGWISTVLLGREISSVMNTGPKSDL